MEIFDKVSASVNQEITRLCQDEEVVWKFLQQEVGTIRSLTHAGQWVFEGDLNAILRIKTILCECLSNIQAKQEKLPCGSAVSIVRDTRDAYDEEQRMNISQQASSNDIAETCVVENQGNIDRKTYNSVNTSDEGALQIKLTAWLSQFCEKPSNDMIKSTANHFAGEMGLSDFHCNNHWIKNFLKRNSLEFPKLNGSTGVGTDNPEWNGVPSGGEEDHFSKTEPEIITDKYWCGSFCPKSRFKLDEYKERKDSESLKTEACKKLKQNRCKYKLCAFQTNEQSELKNLPEQKHTCAASIPTFTEKDVTTHAKLQASSDDCNEVKQISRDSNMGPSACHKQTWVKNIQCELCGKLFARQYRYEEHKRKHMGIRPYKCKICKHFFLSKVVLDKHVLFVHKNQRDHVCDICGKMFYNTCSLKRHVRIHTGEKDFECSQCGKCFIQKTQLHSHMYKHTDERAFQCEICSGRFKTCPELKKHRQNVHENRRNFVCDTCGKSFHQSGGLKRHLKTHTGQKDFECLQCGKKFTGKISLQYHKYIHTGERPFQCILCKDNFNDPSVLRRHVIGVHKMAYSVKKGINSKNTVLSDDEETSEN